MKYDYGTPESVKLMKQQTPGQQEGTMKPHNMKDPSTGKMVKITSTDKHDKILAKRKGFKEFAQGLSDRELTKQELKRREEIAKSLPDADFKKKYGSQWMAIKMATATKMAKNEGLKDPKDNPCWPGHEPVGTKIKNGKTVPNCVPKESIDEAVRFNHGEKVIAVARRGKNEFEITHKGREFKLYQNNKFHGTYKSMDLAKKAMNEVKLVPGFVGADGKLTAKPTAKDYAANKEYQGMKKKGIKLPGPKSPITSADVQKALAIVRSPKYRDYYTGAYNAINRIKSGLAKHPVVAKALRLANENKKQPQTEAKISFAKMARRDAMRGMGKQSKVDPADVDEPSDDGSRAGLNPIMQLRKAKDVKGNYMITFADGKKKKLNPATIDKLLRMHDMLPKPDAKLKFATFVGKSYANAVKASTMLRQEY